MGEREEGVSRDSERARKVNSYEGSVSENSVRSAVSVSWQLSRLAFGLSAETRPSLSWWFHFGGMAFKSSGKILSSWRRYVCISYASWSGSGKIHNCMPFLVNALRKEGQGPIIRCGLERTINSLIAPSFFRQELRRRLSLPGSLKLLEAMFEFDQISWCRSLNGVVRRELCSSPNCLAEMALS